MEALALAIGQQLGAWGTFAAAVYCLVATLYRGVYLAEPSRTTIVRHLRCDTPGAFYRAILTGRLRWLDQWLSPQELALPKETPGKEIAVAWSYRLLSLVLALALAYPILSLMLRWIISGQGDIAGFQIFPYNIKRHQRYIILIGLLFVSLMWFLSIDFSNNKYIRSMEASSSIFFFPVVGVFVIILSIFGLNSVSEGFNSSGIISLSISAVFVSALYGYFSGKYLIFLIIYIAASFSLFGEFSIIFGVLLTIFVFFVVIIENFLRAFGKTISFLIVWVLFGFVIVVGTVISSSGLTDRARGIMLFIGLLPLLNAAADFASIGLTRYFLAQGVARHRPVWAAAKDLACGLIIFTLLGCAIIATLHFVRPADGVPLLNLAALFADLHANPGAYWWLGFMLFSTLLPTLAHATLGLFTLFTLAPPRLRGWIADQFEKGGAGDVVAGRYGYVALCVLATAAIVLPLYLLWQAVRRSPRAVDTVITGFEAFARLIGAV